MPEESSALVSRLDAYGGTEIEIADSAGHEVRQSWDVAVRFKDILRATHLTSYQKKEAVLRTKTILMNKAKSFLRPVSRPEKSVILNERESREKNLVGEIDWIETLTLAENTIEGAKTDFQYAARLKKTDPIVILIDSSHSMKGEKLAWLGVAVFHAALSLRGEHAFAMLTFDSKVRRLKKFSENLSVEEIADRFLEAPPGGFTHMSLGLEETLKEMDESGYRHAKLLLIGDGKYTEGKDPVTFSDRFRKIHILKVGKDIGGRDVLIEMSEKGNGSFHEIRSNQGMEQVLNETIRALVRT